MNEQNKPGTLQQAHEAWRLTLPRQNALDSESAAFAAGYRAHEAQRQAGQESVAFSQFLSDVLTAAGLVEHGKQCKALGRRVADGCATFRTMLYAAPHAERQPLTVSDAEKAFHAWNFSGVKADTDAFHRLNTGDKIEHAFHDGLRIGEALHGIDKVKP